MSGDDAFFAEIAAAPDDPAPYLIYADALMLRGDPRGDLISIQHALETAEPPIAADLRRREAELLDVHIPRVRWRYGFIHAARIDSVDELEQLMEIPRIESTLAELRISGQEVLDVLPWHAAFRRLYIDDVDLRRMHDGDAVRIPERAKQLDTLVVQSPQITFAWSRSPAQIRHLEIRTPQAGLPPVEWPNLESLAVWTEDARFVADLKLPRLRSLRIGGATQFAVSKMRVESLELWGCKLSSKKKLPPHTDVRWKRGKRGLADRDELEAFHEKISRIDNTKLDSPDPTWLFEHLGARVDGLEPEERRTAMATIIRSCEQRLVFVKPTIYYRLGEICDSLVEGFEAEVWLWKCVETARATNDVPNEIHALGLIATTRMRRGDPVHAANIMDRVLAHYRETKNENSLAWALRQRGNIDLVRSAFETAEGFYKEALAIYKKRKSTNDEGIVLSELAGVLWSRQDFEGAVAMIKESIALRAGGSLGLGSCYYNLGAVLNGMGKIEEAIEAGKQSLEIFRKHKRRDGEGQALSLLGELEQRSNRHDVAQQMLEEALACHRERGALRESGITLGNLARVALDRAQWDVARRHAEDAVELHRECNNKYNEGMQLMDQADAAIGERRLDDALVAVEEAVAALVSINNYPGLAAAKCRRGFVAQLRGDYAAAERHYDDATEDSKRGNYPEQIGWTQLYRAVARAQQKKLGDAYALLEEARDYLKDSLQGRETLAVARAVIEKQKPPPAQNFDAHLIARFAV